MENPKKSLLTRVQQFQNWMPAFAGMTLILSYFATLAPALHAAPPPATEKTADQTILNLKNVDIRALISQVADITGYNFIIDPRVKGNVTVISTKPMAADEIYQVFLSILKVHGFAAIKNGRIIKIIPDSQSKQVAIPVASDEKPISGRGDEMVTRVLQVQNTTAHQLVPILRPLIPAYGHLAAYPPTNVIIISDRANNIDRLVNIIKQIDKASDEQTEIVFLEHASATEIVKLLENLQGERFEGRREGVKTTRMTADTRTNSIIISGEPSARNRARDLITQLDTPQKATSNIQVIFLNYAKAADLQKVLEGIKEKLAEASEEVMEPGQRAGEKVTIQADEATNALVITAPPDVQKNFKEVISQLDVRRAQVLVEAIIAEVNDTKIRDLGVQWGYKGRDFLGIFSFNNFGSALAGTINPVASKSAVINTVTASAGLGTLTGGGSETNRSAWNVLVQFLVSDVDANILSTPTLMTLDNKKAEIVVGEEVPFKVREKIVQGNENPYNEIERKDVATKLVVTPHINAGGAITLEIEQEASTVGKKGEFTDPVTNKRSIKTTVLVEDGETIVLGGLINKKDDVNIQRVPLLGDIPILGHLFKSSNIQRTNDNLMVFLRPSVIRDSETQTRLSKQTYDYIRSYELERRKKGISFLPDKQTPLMPELGGPLHLPPSYESLYGPQPAPVESKG